MKINLSLVTTGILGLSLVIGLTGCGAKGKQFSGFKTPEKGKGIVYVYRPSSFIGGGVYYEVKNKNNNDEVIGTLRNGGFISKQMLPGQKVLWAKTESTTTVPVTVKANEIVCVKGPVGMGFLVGRPDLKNIDKQTCKLEIKETQESIE